MEAACKPLSLRNRAEKARCEGKKFSNAWEGIFSPISNQKAWSQATVVEGLQKGFQDSEFALFEGGHSPGF